MSHASSWDRVTADTEVYHGACVLRMVNIKTSAAGGDVTLYDGLDAVSGRKIITLVGKNNETNPIVFGRRGIAIENGLFVDVGSNVDEVLLVFDPIT